MKIFSERSRSRLEPPFFAWRAGSGTLAIRSRMAPISFVNRPIYDKVGENGQVKTTYIRTSTLILHFQLIHSVYATRHCHRHISRWLTPGSGWAFLFAVWDPEAYFLLQIRAEPHPHSWLQVVFIYVLEGRVLHWFDLLGGDGAGIVGGKGPVIRVDNLVNVRVVFPRFQPILGTHTILYACQSNGKI